MIPAEERLSGAEIKREGDSWLATRWGKEKTKKGERMGESGKFSSLLEALSYISMDTYSVEDIKGKGKS